MSNETLAQQIKQRRTLLARMSVQEKEYGKITQGDENLTGTYSRDELKYQLNKLVSEQNRRNLPTDSSTDWVAAAKEKYQDALKAYNAFLQETSNSLSREEFEKKAKELKDAVDTAKRSTTRSSPVRIRIPRPNGRRRTRRRRKPNAANRFLKSWARNSSGCKGRMTRRRLR